MQLPSNTLLQGGKYKIVRFLSSGGFGNTYEALDVNLDKRVAIKEFFVKDFCSRDTASAMVTISVTAKRPLIEHLKKKFVEEARAIARMEHDNIVRVHALFEENSTAYYVMEYIDGEPLSALLKRRGSLQEKEAVAIILKVAGALDYMHRLNRFHLDVKPANIMLRKDGKVILIDFGSSKQYAEVDGENTTTLAPCYTPGYAPSEQMNPKRTAFTAATDIYALGATLYKMLTGLTPPSAIDLVNGEKTLSPLPDEVSRNARECVDKAMVPQRNKRMQSIADFVNTLQASEGIIVADVDVSEGAEETLVVGNEAEELFRLAERYREGKGIEKDLSKAFELYKKAAELGHVNAQTKLGYCYNYGEGVAQDYNEAVRWYREAAEQGYSAAQSNLALCYKEGNGVPIDEKTAIDWYLKSAKQGHYTACKALFDYYWDKDHIEAMKWYRKGMYDYEELMKAKAKELVPWTWGKKVVEEMLGLVILIILPILGLSMLTPVQISDDIHYDRGYIPEHLIPGVIGALVLILFLFFFTRSILVYKRRVKKYKAEHPDDPINEYL